jgi:hypothetical protein
MADRVELSGFCARALAALSLEEAPAIPSGPFRRLALIAHPRHLDALADDGDTLAVSCNWLVWRMAVESGRPCLHFEAIRRGPKGHLPSELYPRSYDWIMDDGQDVTMFHGVSLGRKLVRPVSLAIMEHDQLTECLERLLEIYRPQAIVYFDFQSEFSMFSPTVRRDMLATLAGKHGLEFEDRLDPIDLADPVVPRHDFFTDSAPAKPSLKRRFTGLGRRMAVGVLRRAVNLFSCLSRRPRALILLSQLNSYGLMEHAPPQTVLPVFLENEIPRKRDPAFMAHWARRGLRLVSRRFPELTPDEKREVDSITERLRRLGPRGVVLEVWHHILGRLERGELHDFARQVKWAQELLRREKPDVILTDSMQGILHTILCDLAAPQGIQRLLTWHGHYLQDMKVDVFGGDERFPASLDRILSWGPAMDLWMARNAPSLALERVGKLVGDNFLSRTGSRPLNDFKGTKVLFLQYAVPTIDVLWPQAGQYALFVKVVALLNRLGAEVRVKLHPGPYKTEHYRLIAERYGLDCVVFRDGPFAEAVAWSDLVIGPAASGAMIECATVRKPFLPLVLAPTVSDAEYLGDIPILETAEEVCEALERLHVTDPESIRRQFVDDVPVREVSERIWSALAKAVRP